MNNPFKKNIYLAGCWSPTRPSVVFISTQAGYLQVQVVYIYNYIYKSSLISIISIIEIAQFEST